MQKKLKHENVMKIIEWFSYKSYICIVMEECTCLSKVFRNLNRVQKRQICKQIVKGTAFIHRNNMSHRNLKLENILLLHGIVQISGFGFAIPLE